MKKFLYAAAFAMLSASAVAQNVGVTVTVGQPGFYGQVILGNAPAPDVIYAQPVIIQPGPVGLAPIYLRVPPGYERHWRRHCHQYNACNRPVYFVRDRWYNNVYVPHYRRYEGEYRRHGGHEWRERRFDRDRRFEGDRDRGYRDDGHDRRREGRGRDRDR